MQKNKVFELFDISERKLAEARDLIAKARQAPPADQEKMIARAKELAEEADKLSVIAKEFGSASKS